MTHPDDVAAQPATCTRPEQAPGAALCARDRARRSVGDREESKDPLFIAIVCCFLQDYVSRKGVDVEVWMTALEKQMRMAMRETLKSSLESLVSQVYEQWLLSWPAQAILLSGAIVWCREVTECFKVCTRPRPSSLRAHDPC